MLSTFYKNTVQKEKKRHSLWNVISGPYLFVLNGRSGGMSLVSPDALL